MIGDGAPDRQDLIHDRRGFLIVALVAIQQSLEVTRPCEGELFVAGIALADPRRIFDRALGVREPFEQNQRERDGVQSVGGFWIVCSERERSNSDSPLRNRQSLVILPTRRPSACEIDERYCNIGSFLP